MGVVKGERQKFVCRCNEDRVVKTLINFDVDLLFYERKKEKEVYVIGYLFDLDDRRYGKK